MFHPAAVLRSVEAFDWDRPVPDQGPVDEYCRFFALDEERRIAGLAHACGWIESAGYRVLLHAYRPADCCGSVWICHGYLEHSGLYGKLLPHILRAGYAVLVFDLPGHGLSSGPRASIPEFTEYQQVLGDLIQLAEGRLPRPWLGLGQSTGGAILMDHVLQRRAAGLQAEFDRILLLAPLVHPTRLQWWQIRSAFWFVRALRSGLPRNFRRNSSDADFLHFIRHEDPLQARWLPLQWILAMKDWITHIHRFPATDFPVWLVQGGRDATVNGPYNLGFIRQRFHLVRSVQIPEASHQLANERDDIRAPLDALLQEFLSYTGPVAVGGPADSC